MTPKISIAYVTGRPNPQWQWFCDSLCAQTTPEQRAQLELVFVDGHLWAPGIRLGPGIVEIGLTSSGFYDESRLAPLADSVAGRFPSFIHLPPLPCAWQGPFRQTTRDFFCAGNTRNTAFVVARAPYVVFVDDLSVLMPGWFNQVLHAAQDQYIVCGAYKKVKKLHVTPCGTGVSYEEFPAGVDTRWPCGSDGGIVPWHGSGMFGCSFGLPLEAALEVDGNDAALLGQGAEDTDFGIRLERAGWPICYNRNMLTLESEELHHDGSKLPQERKIVVPDRLPAGYEAWNHVNPAEKYWSDHVTLNRLINEPDRTLPVIGDNLREIRAKYQATGLVPVPVPGQVDWRTGGPLKDL